MKRSGLSLFDVIDVNRFAFVHFSCWDEAELAVDVQGTGVALFKGQIDMLAVVLFDHFADESEAGAEMLKLEQKLEEKEAQSKPK